VEVAASVIAGGREEEVGLDAENSVVAMCAASENEAGRNKRLCTESAIDQVIR
jgi:hypothetical protein